MFTGLIEAVGEVVESTRTTAGVRLCVRTSLAGELRPGESLAVNGVCLTVTVIENSDVHANIGPETASVTTLEGLRPGQPVNLERPMRADARFGGHFVQGHVDATGRVEEVRAEPDAHWLTVSFPRALAPYLVHKGSIAVDGISLTISGLGQSQFDVMIIPFTWSHTNLAALRAGDPVNLECDMIGKYVARVAELAVDQARRMANA